MTLGSRSRTVRAAASVSAIEGFGHRPRHRVTAVGPCAETARTFLHCRDPRARHRRPSPFANTLTRLPNRHCLLEQLEAIVATAGPANHIGLCFLDLDEFKLINDRYGHRAGDSVLAEVGRRLDATLTSSAVTPARIGGDEFVALLAPPCDDGKAHATAEPMLATLSDPIPVGPTDLLVLSGSIGAVVAPVAGANAEKLLNDADVGLYRAKAAGRVTWVLHRDDHDRATE